MRTAWAVTIEAVEIRNQRFLRNLAIGFLIVGILLFWGASRVEAKEADQAEVTDIVTGGWVEISARISAWGGTDHLAIFTLASGEEITTAYGGGTYGYEFDTAIREAQRSAQGKDLSVQLWLGEEGSGLYPLIGLKVDGQFIWWDSQALNAKEAGVCGTQNYRPKGTPEGVWWTDNGKFTVEVLTEVGAEDPVFRFVYHPTGQWMDLPASFGGLELAEYFAFSDSRWTYVAKTNCGFNPTGITQILEYAPGAQAVVWTRPNGALGDWMGAVTGYPHKREGLNFDPAYIWTDQREVESRDGAFFTPQCFESQLPENDGENSFRQFCMFELASDQGDASFTLVNDEAEKLLDQLWKENFQETYRVTWDPAGEVTYSPIP